jgi:hypothetical protein
LERPVTARHVFDGHRLPTILPGSFRNEPLYNAEETVAGIDIRVAGTHPFDLWTIAGLKPTCPV